MGKKVRIKNILNRETRTLSDSYVSVGDIIEVEEIEEINRPEDCCSCGQCEFDKPKKTLVDQFNGCDMKYVTPEQLAIIAEVYHKAHPEEIDCVSRSQYQQCCDRAFKAECFKQGMVSPKTLIKILFQDSKSLWYFDQWWVDKKSIKKAIRKLEK